jgi:hypothetical protein
MPSVAKLTGLTGFCQGKKIKKFVKRSLRRNEREKRESVFLKFDSPGRGKSVTTVQKGGSEAYVTKSPG